MAPVLNSESATLSPCSPPRKKAKFSLRLKGKKMKNEEDDKSKGNVYPIFSSPPDEHDENQDETNTPRELEIPSLPHAGLLNQGNTCYANAVLQILRCCTGFKQLVRYLANKGNNLKNNNQVADQNDKTEQLISQLDKLLCQMSTFEEDFLENKECCIHLSTKGNNLVLAAETFNFMEAFRELYPSFESTLQHDAQEFLCSLIMALVESAENKSKKTNVKSFLTECKQSKGGEYNCDVLMMSDSSTSEITMEQLFQGKLVHQTKCLNCEESKFRYEDFQDVSVPVVEDQPYLDARKKLMLSPTPKKDKDSVLTLQWAVAQFASRECLQGDNKYFCENCNTYCEAEIRTCFDKLPHILTIHLKRFTSSVGLSSKITSNLETPFILSVQEWCSKKCQLESNVYELFGIVVHSGMTSGSGHYETYVRLSNDKKLHVGRFAIRNDGCLMGKIDEEVFKNNAESHNGILQSDQTMDVNGNCVFEKNEKNLKINENCKRKRYSEDESRMRQMGNETDETEKIPIGIKEVKRKKEDCEISNGSTSSEKTQSSSIEGQSQVQTSCMSAITRYFQRSRKVSSGMQSIKKQVRAHLNTEKNENSNEDKISTYSMVTDDMNLQKNGSENCENKAACNELNSKTEPVTTKAYGSIESYFKKTISSHREKTISKSPAIRRLNFQESPGELICSRNSEQPKESDGYRSNSSDEDMQITNTSKHCVERLKTGWVHFDDCMVNPLSQQDVLSILSSSQSSFSSPYLLFYRRFNLT